MTDVAEAPSPHPDIEEVLVTGPAIQARLEALATEIDAHYAGRDLLIVGVLKGAFVLMADLARCLQTPVSFDFMAVSSYGSATRTSGVVRILKDLEREISGRHVLLVEDIIDSGLTLRYLMRNLGARGPASLEVLSLLVKPEQAEVDLGVRWQGFEVPNVFVVGYGLDYAERYRNLPYIGTLRREVYGG